jgi:hypothetical protein
VRVHPAVDDKTAHADDIGGEYPHIRHLIAVS